MLGAKKVSQRDTRTGRLSLLSDGFFLEAGSRVALRRICHEGRSHVLTGLERPG